MRFFIQTDVKGTPYPETLWRYRFGENLIYEECWSSNAQMWIRTRTLTRMIVHGESTLEEITLERARTLVPLAFKD
jgi:hypothetical protein